jgi:DNA-binding IclR family transcriptional regulator
VDIYAIVLDALNGQGWSTVEETARRAGLPQLAVNNTLTELVGQGHVFVRIDGERDPAGAVLVYSDEP